MLSRPKREFTVEVKTLLLLNHGTNGFQGILNKNAMARVSSYHISILKPRWIVRGVCCPRGKRSEGFLVQGVGHPIGEQSEG